MSSTGNMSQQFRGRDEGGAQPFSNAQPATMNGDMDVQQSSRAFAHSMQPQHRSYINEAAHILRDVSEPDWHKKGEAYQRKFLRGMRLEMVDRDDAFGLDRSHEDFEILLGAAHANLQRDYEKADDALFESTYDELVQWSAYNFRFWMKLNRDQRSCALKKWDSVLNHVSLEDPGTSRFDRLLKVLQVMQEKSRIFDQEEIDLDREAALIEQAMDMKSGKTAFELGDDYYKGNSSWTTKPVHYQRLFLNRLLSTPMTDVAEQQLAASLHKVLEERARFFMFDRKMRNDQGKYWPEPSYDQPDSPVHINWNIIYHRVYNPWNRDEVIQRFTRAWRDLSREEYPYGHLPYEVSLLLALPRIDFPKLPQRPLKLAVEEEPDTEEACGEPTEDKDDPECDEQEIQEEVVAEEEDEEEEEESNDRTHVPSKGDVPFLPDPYPYKISDVKNHPNWTELQEFLSYVYGVDEGEMAERVVTTNEWNTCRNLIRKRIAYKRTLNRILDPDTIPVRKGQVTEIAEQIVNGGMIGRQRHLPLTDEQLLFNVTWDIDIWQGTMKQNDGADDAQTFALPSPHEIESGMLKKLLRSLGRGNPTMNWLITKYPHLRDTRPRPQTTRPEIEPDFGQSAPSIDSSTAGAMAAMTSSLAGLRPATSPEYEPVGYELAHPGRSAHLQVSQQTARLGAPTYAGSAQHYSLGVGLGRRQQPGLQESGQGSGLDFGLNYGDETKRGPTFPAFGPGSFVEDPQSQQGHAPVANMAQGGMRSSQFSLQSPVPTPQEYRRPGLAVDENGRATVVVMKREDIVEPENGFFS